MRKDICLFVYPVKDLAKSKELFGKLLGVEPYVEGGYYVGYKVGDQEIGLDPNGHRQGLTGPLGYFQVENIHESLKTLVAAGATITQPARDVGGGMLVAVLKDADGNPIGLRQI